MDRIHFTIVDRGKAKKIIQIAKENNIHEATILNAEGTFKSKILEPLGLLQTSKEIVMFSVNKKQDELLHEKFSQEFDFNKRNRGISFSVLFNEWDGKKSEMSFEKEEINTRLIMVITEKSNSLPVIEAARSANAKGGTIIHGHGYKPKLDYEIPITINSQKDTILIIANDDKLNDIKNAISEVLEASGEKFLICLPVVKTSGLLEERLEKRWFNRFRKES